MLSEKMYSCWRLGEDSCNPLDDASLLNSEACFWMVGGVSCGDSAFGFLITFFFFWESILFTLLCFGLSYPPYHPCRP